MLTIVPSPIGNLKDISFRALEVLKSVELIACEDTRHSGQLLKHYEIKKHLISFHEHNEASRTAELMLLLLEGKDIALLSDAGMPGISDPGYKLIQECIRNEIQWTVLPGASAFMTAALLSGLPLRPLYFEGFLPPKSAARLKRLQEIAGVEATLIFYEAPHRIEKILHEIHQVFPDSPVALVKEISKLHETVHRGKAGELLKKMNQINMKGEWVVLIDRLSPQLKKKFRY